VVFGHGTNISGNPFMSEQMYYFGYGSLVNRQTRDESEQVIPATLHGWERQWAHRAEIPGLADTCVSRNHCQGICALTIVESQGCAIDGVLARIDPTELQDLDRREAGYDRLSLDSARFTIDGDVDVSSIYVYRSTVEKYGWANDVYPVAQSYVDVVITGYQDLFGDDGVSRFMDTTRGWNGPILSDRDLPAYVRALMFDRDKLQQIDTVLDHHKNRA